MALFADRMKETELPHCLDICKRKPPPEAPAETPGAEREEEASATDWRLLCDRFIVAWRFMFQEKRMMLLIPLITYGTMQQALNVAVFTRAFVGCTLGVHWIGYVMICYGVCDAFSAFLIGRIRNWVPRQALVAVGGLLNLSLMVHLLAMTPHPQYAAVFFVHVGLWGVADAIWQTQINSLYGVLFPGCQEVAFSMDGFWGAIGYTVAFSYGGYLCASVKIYILLSLLGVSMTTYTPCWRYWSGGRRHTTKGSVNNAFLSDVTVEPCYCGQQPAGGLYAEILPRRRSAPELGNSTDQLAHKNSQAKTGIDNMEFSDVSKKEDGTDAGAITPSYQNAEGSTDPLATTAIPKWRSLQNLQSSLNYDEGLGVASLSVIYASLIVSCIFVPPILIGKIGCKWTLVVSIFWYSVFTAGNFYASWYTLMPFSVTLGLAGAPLWTAKSKYVTTSGMRYAGMVGETQEDVITMFFGIFFMDNRLSACPKSASPAPPPRCSSPDRSGGNLISSLVLERGNVTSLGLTPEELSAICGANNCPNSTGALQPPTTSTVNLLVGIYLGCGLFAVLVLAVFLDKLKGEGEREEAWAPTPDRDSETPEGRQTTGAAGAHHHLQRAGAGVRGRGLHKANLGGLAAFGESFVSCALGIEWIGYVMICYGVCDAIFSFLLGRLIKLTGRIPLFLTGAVAHLAMIITMLVWSPDPGKLEVFFVLAAFWGLGDAVWQLEINGERPLYGYLFRKNQEAGFSNYRLWESLGFVVAFAYSNFLCTDVKLYILLAVLVLGMMGYALVEYNERKDPEESERGCSGTVALVSTD
ncbi:Protein unc-93 A [Branchiostoma belcheri]|nr:Protein unc-93 A [Branchiostoma belcheri]